MSLKRPLIIIKNNPIFKIRKSILKIQPNATSNVFLLHKQLDTANASRYVLKIKMNSVKGFV